MGSDVFVYFSTEGEQVSTAELDEIARDSGRADIGAAADSIVARLDPDTQVREGEEAELWADTRMVHVFDPTNGNNLGLGETPVRAGAAAVT
jgi:multiple sugar transport system ATP-binding protein